MEYELVVTRSALDERGSVVRVPEDVDGLVQRVHDRELLSSSTVPRSGTRSSSTAPT